MNAIGARAVIGAVGMIAALVLAIAASASASSDLFWGKGGGILYANQPEGATKTEIFAIPAAGGGNSS